MFSDHINLLKNLEPPQFETNEERKIDYIDSLPNELKQKIFSYLNRPEEIINCSLVNKVCKALTDDEKLHTAIQAFGKTQWEIYFGDVGIEPPLPREIYKILKRPCPFSSDKKIEETHMLILIPETVNGHPLSLETLEELIKKQGRGTHYRYLFDEFQNYKNLTNPKSHWVLMKKDLIEESRGKSYRDQQALIARYAQDFRIRYEVPNLLDATVCICAHYMRFQEYLFGNNTYTRCQERALQGQVVVGGFSSYGIYINDYLFDCKSVGIGPLCNFINQ